MADDRPFTAWHHRELPQSRSPASDDQDQDADERDQRADARDRVSVARDQEAKTRDDRAEVRDRYAEARDRFDANFNAPASSDRLGAGRDRQNAADDRSHSAGDRKSALIDRVLSVREREASSIDELTGAYRRDAGLVELAREVARARRTKTHFVLAFIDVDGLKATNDSLGHYAGDQLLSGVVNTMRAHLRSYDLIVRFGGDEFLCGLLALRMAMGTERFMLINADLAANNTASITAGLAELNADDSLDGLIARADTALRTQRQQRPSARA